MKALAPYLASAALLLPPPVATIRAMPEPVTEAGIFVAVCAESLVTQGSDLATYSWDLNRPELAPDFVHGLLVEDDTETYEPFIAAEAWREIAAPMGPVRIEFEGRPVSFFDEHDLAGIDIYE
jgi:hypothetical protein